MAIARKPGSKPTPATDEAADRFIAAAGKPAVAATEAEEDARKVPIMIRFDRALLERVTAEAKRNGISRSAWISHTLAQKLNEAG